MRIKTHAIAGLLVFFLPIKGQVISDTLIMLPDQHGIHWWNGIVTHGQHMPLTNGYQANTFGNTYGNQAQPLLLSAEGDYIWSEEPFSVVLEDHQLTVSSEGGKLVVGKPGNTLREAYLSASKNHFPAAGKLPDMLLVTSPQYNTWIELMYDQNQEDILRYARSIIESGFPPGVLMIDDNWQEDYGKWVFHPGRFPDPHMMIDSLHSMGFKIMMWICPFISPDSDVFRELRDSDFLLKTSRNHPAIIPWWNGHSALIDLSNPDADIWFTRQMDHLVNNYAIDGFKLDAGDAKYYMNLKSYRDISPNEHSRLYGEIGLDYPLNEYRAIWKMGGQPLVQRLRDKGHNWDDLSKIIPDMLIQGLMGYQFTCPDMIGGGEYRSFLNASEIDQELIVRSSQVHALMPMMQFSVSPWRVLDEKHLAAVKKALQIRDGYISFIEDLVIQSSQTGEPVVRPMEYVFPHQGYADIRDQFMLGDQLLVAPILKKGGRSRNVIFPEGKWKGADGKVYRGPDQKVVTAELHEIPVFELIK